MARPELLNDAVGPNVGPAEPRVLLIEDEATIRALMVEYLHADGYVVDAAGDLTEGGRLLQERHPAVIALDLMMPGQNGWDLLRERRHNPQLSAVPVVVVSAAHRDMLATALELGANACLHKSFDLDELSRIVNDCLARDLVAQA